MNKNCQSCGVPMKRDPKGGGTNTDGSKNKMYSSYCYQAVEFTQPEITTPEQMQDFCVKKMKEMGFPRIIGKFSLAMFPNLNDGKKNNNIIRRFTGRHTQLGAGELHVRHQ